MIFMSGAAWPQEELPDVVRRAAEALPLTHVVALLADAWTGHPLELWRVGVLGALAVGATAIAAVVLADQ